MRKKAILTIAGTVVFAGAAIALPILVINNSLKHSTSFNYDKIGIYVEKTAWDAYSLAVKKYNEKYPDHKYDIQMLELGAFDAVDLIQTLGYADQKVADLIYCPIDRIPSLVEHNGALMGFKNPNDLISNEFDPKIYEGIGIESFAKKSEALVVPPDSENKEPQPFYFGVPHSTESLVLYYKGFSDDELTSIQKITEVVNVDNWTNSMYSFKFNDLWYALGVIAGFLEVEKTGAGTNGQLVGKVLVSNNTLTSKYQSNVVNVSDKTNPDYPIQDYGQTPGWNDSGVSIETSKATKALQKTLDYLASYYNRSKVKNNLLGSNNNDWLLDGDKFSPITTTLSEKAQKAALIDGPWMVATYSGIFDRAIAVPNLVDNVPYLQAPGGWLYAINQRNNGNAEKIRDMKRFLNILLTDEEVIMAQYKDAGKIIEGTFAKTLLENYANNPATNQLEASVIKAVFNSKTMDQRPDGGNANFSNVWSRWDENGFRAPSTRDFLVKETNIQDAEVSKRLKSAFATSFSAMLKGLQEK